MSKRHGLTTWDSRSSRSDSATGIRQGRDNGMVPVATLIRLLWLLRPLHVTGSLQCFPLLKCGFDCLKISMLAVFRMLFHGSASPGEPTMGCRTNGVFAQNVRQCLGELAIKRRNVRAATHDLRKGRDPPALTVILLSALRASELFGK
jgi:hypothetical protein